MERFPESFRFQLSEDEFKQVVADCDRFSTLKHSSVYPYAFTEQGVAMLSAVLHSEIAVQVSISIMEAFVAMRHDMSSRHNLAKRMDILEFRQIEMRQDLDLIFKRFEDRKTPPAEGVFFDGQIFDAYVFATELIRSARKSITLIDNYIDESVLLMLSKRENGVSADIHRRISYRCFSQRSWEEAFCIFKNEHT